MSAVLRQSRMRRRQGWLGAVLLALMLAAAPSLRASSALADYFQETWSTAEGLPHNHILDIEQDAEGFLWLATWEGAARFNGHDFDLLGADQLPEETERAVTELGRLDDGSLLIGSARGDLLSQSALGWKREPEAQQGRGLPMYALLAVADRRYIGTAGSGLWQQLKGGLIEPVPGAEALAKSLVYALASDGRSLWVGTDSGLYKLSDGRWEGPQSYPGLPRISVLSLALADDGRLLVATVSGAFVVRDGQAQPLHPALPAESFESLLVDRHGDIWLGGASLGLFRVGARGVEQLDSAEGLPSNRVVSLFEDRERSIWVGTSRGLFRLREAPFVSITERHGLQDVYARTLLKQPDGGLLVGTSGGVAVIDRGAEGDRVLRTELAEESVLSLALGADGSLWVGTYYNGLLQQVDGRVARRIGRAEGLPSVQVRALLADPDGLLQIGTSRGLARWDGSRLQVFGAADGLPSESVIGLHRDRHGELWVGTNTGIAVERDGRFVAIDPAELEGALRIYGFAEDAEGRFYVAHDRGISMADGAGWRQLTARQGMPIGSVFAVLFDGDGDFWLSSNRGVLRVARAAALAALRGEQRLQGWELFAEADGMVSAQCNGAAGLPALVDSSGELWFATAGGVVHVDPRRLPQFSRVLPEVRIEQLRVDGQPRPLAGQLVLEPAAQRVELRYVGLNFQIPKKIRYRYRLEGFDADWIDAGTQRSLQFTNLAPGSYQLRIQAANPSGEWSPDEARLALLVEPWWWERPGVHLAGLLLALGLMALAARWRLRQLEAQRAELQRRVDQATADLQRQASVLQEQNVELDAYAHSVAHDLKNPLVTVIGMSSLVRSIGAGMPESQRLDMIGRIHAAGLKMVEIIDALLLLSRARSDSELSVGSVALGPLVAETLRSLAAQAGAAGAQISVAEDLPAVTGYGPWIERVLTNYIGNAIKYGGDPPRIEIGCSEDGAMREIWVRDHGPGLTQEAQARLFQPFSRAGRVGGDGQGLGLSIVRRIVERMGGSVGCDSRPGEGSRFWFRLPAAATTKEA